MKKSNKVSQEASAQQKKLPDLYNDFLRYLDYCKNKKTKSKYDLNEEILQAFVKEYPNHKSFPAVFLKASLLNQFYSTGIQAIDAMAANIMSIEDIDDVLKEPQASPALIHEIANLKIKDNKPRYNYSFATKYCALHQPEKYPIYDSIVANIFYQLACEGYLGSSYAIKSGRNGGEYTKGKFFKKLKEYDSYLNVYDTFMKSSGLYGMPGVTYRQVDWYLWGAFKDGDFKSEVEKIVKLDSSLYTTITELKLPKQHKLNRNAHLERKKDK